MRQRCFSCVEAVFPAFRPRCSALSFQNANIRICFHSETDFTFKFRVPASILSQILVHGVEFCQEGVEGLGHGCKLRGFCPRRLIHVCRSGLSAPVVLHIELHVCRSGLSAPVVFHIELHVCIFGPSAPVVLLIELHGCRLRGFAPVVLLIVRHVYGSVFCHAEFLLKRFLFLINCSIFVERIRKVILTLIVDIVYNNRCVRRVNVLTYHKSNIMKKYSFREAEAKCEATFSYTKHDWWHLYTLGKETSIIFSDDDDYRYSMNQMAKCSSEFPELAIVAFELMSNHLHIVLTGEEKRVNDYFAVFRHRLVRYFAKRNVVLADEFKMTLKKIKDLASLRNVIVYVNRNGYVVQPNHTPFSYPWGTGFCYFNMEPKGLPLLKDMPYRDLRKFFKARPPENPESMQMMNGYVMPSSYCAVKLGMAMFRDAHHYFSLLTKNVEEYLGIAKELDDGEFLTDNEMYAQLSKILQSVYGVSSVKELSKAQVRELAKKLHYEYRSSNGQVSRMLGLTKYDVDAMFPLSKSRE